MMRLHLSPSIAALWMSLSCAQALSEQLNYESLPLNTIFPGPWESDIRAPKNKSHIAPVKVFKTEGAVLDASILLDGGASKSGLVLGPGDLVSLEFAENIAGRYVLLQ